MLHRDGVVACPQAVLQVELVGALHGAHVQRHAQAGRLGHLHQDTPSAREIVIDDALNLVTTPAYMFDDARLSDVFVGIERCVAEVLKRA